MKQKTNESIETEAGGSGLASGQEQVAPEVINTKHEILKCDTKPLPKGIEAEKDKIESRQLQPISPEVILFFLKPRMFLILGIF